MALVLQGRVKGIVRINTHCQTAVKTRKKLFTAQSLSP